jgi:ABC-type nitrate/sulfonate/bicarbonate transport system substrate-binding protein
MREIGWAVSTGANRPISSVADLKNAKIGVSRIGSGSYVMGFVLADKQGWLSSSSSPPFENIPLQTFEKLRQGVNDSTVDFFMWEHFTSKRYYDNGEIKRIGEIYTPWPSWQIVASSALIKSANGRDDSRLNDLFEKIDQGVDYLDKHHQETIEYISTELDYSKEDAAEWLKTVRFSSRTQGVNVAVVEKTVEVLKKAGVLGEDGMSADDMIGKHSGAQLP